MLLEATIMVDWVADYSCIVKNSLLYDAHAMNNVYKIYYWFPISENDTWDRGLSRVEIALSRLSISFEYRLFAIMCVNR